MREIIQHLAFILNQVSSLSSDHADETNLLQRDHRGQSGPHVDETDDSEDEDMDTSTVEDAVTSATEVAHSQDVPDAIEHTDKYTTEHEFDALASSEEAEDEDYVQQTDDQTEHESEAETRDGDVSSNRTTTLKMSPRFLRKISREDYKVRTTQDDSGETATPSKAKPRGSNTWNRERDLTTRETQWYDAHFPDGREPPNWSVADLVDGLGLNREDFDEVAAFTRSQIDGHDYLLSAALNGGAAQERITVIIDAMEERYSGQALEKQPNCTKRFRERSWREFIKKECGKLRKEQNIATGRAPRKDKKSLGIVQIGGSEKSLNKHKKTGSLKKSPGLHNETSPDLDQAGSYSTNDMPGNNAAQHRFGRYPSEKYDPPDSRKNSPDAGKNLQQAKKQGSEFGRMSSWQTVNGGSRKHHLDDVSQASSPSSPNSQLPNKRAKGGAFESNIESNTVLGNIKNSASPHATLETSQTSQQDSTALASRPQQVTPARSVVVPTTATSPSDTRITPSSGLNIAKRGTWPIRYGYYDADDTFRSIHEGMIGPATIAMIYETIGKQVGPDFDEIEITVDENCSMYKSLEVRKFTVPRTKPYKDLHDFLHQPMIEKRWGSVNLLLQPVSNAMTDGEDLI